MDRSAAAILTLTVGSSIVILVIFSVFIFYIVKLYNKRQIEFTNNLLLSRIENEKKILSTRVEVFEETTQKISREIHDNVNQLLTLSKINLNSLNTNELNGERISITIDLITSAIGELTNISRSLSSEILNEVGLFRSIEYESERLNKLNLINIVPNLSLEITRLNPELQLIIYRIFQEATRNSIIHGKAKNILVNIDQIGNYLILEICDDGKGFNYEKFLSSQNFKHQGLLNMRKRIELFDGDMQIKSEEGSGTSLKFKIPLPNS